MDKKQRKRRDKTKFLFVDWTLDNCVCLRESIIISDKNNEDAIFKINNQSSEAYAKSCEHFFLLNTVQHE